MENASKTINTSLIATIIANDLNEKFGLNISDKVVSEEKIMNEITEAKLEVPQNLGIFTMIIMSAEITLGCSVCSDGSIWVLAFLDYTHPCGGSNRKNIGRYRIRGNEIEDCKIDKFFC